MACELAGAASQQVVVDGAQRAGETVHTSGHRVPLLHALEQVVPGNYSVNVPNAGAWADMPVSWQAGGSFVQVLGELLAGDPSLQARVDTDLHLVTVSAVPRAPTLESGPEAAPVATASHASAPGAIAPSNLTSQRAPLAPAASLAPAESVVSAPLSSTGLHASTPAVVSASPANDEVVVGPALSASGAPQAPAAASLASAVPMPAPALAPAPVAASAPPSQVWEMRESDGSVRNAIQRWATEAGWQFIWDVPTDFTVDANATIHGTLEQALGAVVDALSTAQVPIQIVMYKGNRVLRVIPKGAG